MAAQNNKTLLQKTKRLIIGKSLDPYDKSLFHKLSLIAFLAWVGLGSDGISSSCYGPDEAYRTVGSHYALALFVGFASFITIFVISASYHQIIELFPTGGGGYIVASKLLSPEIGMISGCALIVDYVLTVTISVASGADALFSFLPTHWLYLKLYVAVFGVLLLMLMNLKGVKESVVPLVPIFLVFIITHLFAILYSIISHVPQATEVIHKTSSSLQQSYSTIGIAGMIMLILRAYSMGAGTFTGIEAVSNGIPILRDPKVHTAKRTMTYMSYSLAITVMGLMVAYVIYNVSHEHGKTLNAVLFEHITQRWNKHWGYSFVTTILLSEAVLLFVAAQTGFLDAPRVLANMAIDRWLPNRFSLLSDRFVTQNGVLIVGFAALILMVATRGSVRFIVVLYSINVFITFSLSQLGMVRHWWQERQKDKHWKKKLLVNGVGLILTSFLLVSIIIIKFSEGGWITLVVTGSLAIVALVVKRHYNYTGALLGKLDKLVLSSESRESDHIPHRLQNGTPHCEFDPKAQTAIMLVNGFSGLGLYTLFNIHKTFERNFKNFVFVQIAVLDAAVMRDTKDVEQFQTKTKDELDRYVKFVNRYGYYAESFVSIGNDVVEEVDKITPKILDKFHHAVFFGGQIVFPESTFLSKALHNYVVFTIQKKFYQEGIPFVILPVRV